VYIPIIHTLDSWFGFPPLTDPYGHAIAIATFGFVGYWAEVWDVRSTELIAKRRQEITARREAIAAATTA
jgi:hypothetical protein